MTETEDQLQREAQQWLIRLTSGQATTSDAAEFRRWCALSTDHAQAFANARQLWQALGPAAQQIEKTESSESQGAAHSASEIVPLPQRRMGRRAFLTGAVAASAAFVFVRPSFMGEIAGLLADYHTGVGEQRSVTLSNTTALELNTQTRINQQVFNDGSQGVELLSGEVEVLTQAPFKMRAGTGWVGSDDGKFVVRSTGPEVMVTCVAGHLTVSHQGSNFQLSSNQQISYSEQSLSEPVEVNTQVVTAWRQRLLIFENETLAHVINELNRYHSGRIMLMNEKLGQRRVQARFKLDQLSDVAELIRDAYGAKVRQLPAGVVLVG